MASTGVSSYAFNRPSNAGSRDSEASSSSLSGGSSQVIVGGNNRGPTFQYKVVLLGESGVGKTNLATQFVKNEFHPHSLNTIGVAFFSHSIRLPASNTNIRFDIWDTAGQERYSSLAPMYYRGALVALVVYDISNRKSFDRAKEWVKELQGQMDLNILVAFVANKKDLDQEKPSQRKVEAKEGQTYATENGLLFAETSAKTGENVLQTFTQIAEQLEKRPPPPSEGEEGRVSPLNGINSQGNNSSESKCC